MKEVFLPSPPASVGEQINQLTYAEEVVKTAEDLARQGPPAEKDPAAWTLQGSKGGEDVRQLEALCQRR